jgi:hypothetical protein
MRSKLTFAPPIISLVISCLDPLSIISFLCAF